MGVLESNEDGLRSVSIWCHTCGASAIGRPDATHVVCGGCGGFILLRRCPQCSHVYFLPPEALEGVFGLQCRSCGEHSPRKRWDERQATLGDVATAGLDAGPHADPDRRILKGWVAASTGFPHVQRGVLGRLDFDKPAIFVFVDGPEPSPPVATITYAGVRSLSVGGRGAVTTTTGGGWIGGGFGVEGAVEGVLMATVLNSLTTRSTTTVETLVHLNAGSQSLVLLNQQLTPMAVETRLAPVFARLQDAHKAREEPPAVTAATIDPLAQLERLAGLLDRGIVTPEEFAATKAELLRRLAGG